MSPLAATRIMDFVLSLFTGANVARQNHSKAKKLLNQKRLKDYQNSKLN